jgi:hypothetical protein
MSAILVASVAGYIVGLPTADPADVENDTLTAHGTTLNVNIPRVGPVGGFLNIEPFFIPESNANLAAPATPVPTQAAGGALGATTYYVKTSYVTQTGGESLLSAEASIAASANNVITVPSPAAETGAVYWKVYVSNTAGGGSGTETMQAYLPVGTAWTEPTSGLIAGSALPNAETGLANGACTVFITQGAGSITLAPTQ